MSRSPKQHQQLIEQRKKRSDGGEPINQERRSLWWSGNSLVVGLTHIGKTVHELTDDDSVVVETYQDGIWIGVDNDDGGDE